MVDGYAGHDPEYMQKIRIICTRPYHALFMKQMLRRDTVENLRKSFAETGPDFTILNAGEFVADPGMDEMTSQTSVCVNFTSKE